ncbi:MAG: histidine kinase, partial [Pirellulaceae bacterium]|nr:histidine kinase [Pirellulaceae bacterium]
MDIQSPGPDADKHVSRRNDLETALRDEHRQLEQEKERHKWLAHELHDGLLQDILAARMLLDTISPGGETASQDKLELATELLERAVLEARQLVGDLRTIQQADSLAETLRSLAQDGCSGLLGGRP